MSDKTIDEREMNAGEIEQLRAERDTWKARAEAAEKWMLMIDEVCCDFGAPEYRMTEDCEAWYWCFPGHELPVADNLSELFVAASQMTALIHVSKSEAKPQERP